MLDAGAGADSLDCDGVDAMPGVGLAGRSVGLAEARNGELRSTSTASGTSRQTGGRELAADWNCSQ